jgi:hypothetical protein
MTANIQRVVNFNGIALSSVPGLTVYAIDDDPDRTVNMLAVARRNASVVSSAFYQQRIIYISVFINTASRALVDQSLDQLMAILQGIEGQLVFEQSGGVRAFTCTYTDKKKNNSGVGKANVAPPSGGFTDFTLEFDCSDAFGYDTNYTVIQPSTAYTSGNLAWQYTQGGSAPTQVPFFQARYTALSTNTTDTVTIGNQNTGQQIAITRVWAVNDLLTIDTKNKSVQVNGVDVPFVGSFPEFQPSVVGGVQTFYYLDTFNSRTFSFYSYVYNRYV